MSRYIKAEQGLNHTIIYTDDSGRYFRFSGGTWTWRNHNPGNLFPSEVSAKHNRIGRTKHFAIFPDYENGHLALLDCLQTTYGEKPIDYLVKKFAPAEDGNDVEVYKKFLHDKSGVTDDKKVKDLINCGAPLRKCKDIKKAPLLKFFQFSGFIKIKAEFMTTI